MEKWKMIMMVAVFAVWILAAAYAGDSANGAARNDAGNCLCADGSADVEDSVCTVDAVGFADIEGSTASLRGMLPHTGHNHSS